MMKNDVPTKADLTFPLLFSYRLFHTRNHELALPTSLSSRDFNIGVFPVQLLSSGGTELRCWNPGLQSDSESQASGQCGSFSSWDCICSGGVAAGCWWQDKEAADNNDEIQCKWSVIPKVLWVWFVLWCWLCVLESYCFEAVLKVWEIAS